MVNLEASVHDGIKTLSGIYAASRPIQQLREMWTLSEMEIDQLAAPLAACLESLPVEIVEKANRFGPVISLGVAVYMIIIPRVMLEKQILDAIRAGQRVTFETTGAGGNGAGDSTVGSVNGSPANASDGVNAFAGFFR